MFYFSPLYFVFALPALLLGMYAQYRVSSAYNKFSQERNRANITGLEAAHRLLTVAGLGDVGVGETPGQLSDHYDPRSKKLFLSQGVARNASVAALGIVAHEVGHAVQDQQEYVPMKIRSAIVPALRRPRACHGTWHGHPPCSFRAALSEIMATILRYI